MPWNSMTDSRTPALPTPTLPRPAVRRPAWPIWLAHQGPSQQTPPCRGQVEAGGRGPAEAMRGLTAGHRTGAPGPVRIWPCPVGSRSTCQKRTVTWRWLMTSSLASLGDLPPGDRAAALSIVPAHREVIEAWARRRPHRIAQRLARDRGADAAARWRPTSGSRSPGPFRYRPTTRSETPWSAAGSACFACSPRPRLKVGPPRWTTWPRRSPPASPRCAATWPPSASWAILPSPGEPARPQLAERKVGRLAETRSRHPKPTIR